MSSSTISNTAFPKQQEKFARRIAGDTANELILERARAVAQAELDLACVRRAEIALITRFLALGEPDPAPDRFAEAMQRALPGLVRLDRYERRASARRDAAVRALAVRGYDNWELCTGKTNPN